MEEEGNYHRERQSKLSKSITDQVAPLRTDVDAWKTLREKDMVEFRNRIENDDQHNCKALDELKADFNLLKNTLPNLESIGERFESLEKSFTDMECMMSQQWDSTQDTFTEMKTKLSQYCTVTLSQKTALDTHADEFEQQTTYVRQLGERVDELCSRLSTPHNKNEDFSMELSALRELSEGLLKAMESERTARGVTTSNLNSKLADEIAGCRQHTENRISEACGRILKEHQTHIQSSMKLADEKAKDEKDAFESTLQKVQEKCNKFGPQIDDTNQKLTMLWEGLSSEVEHRTHELNTLKIQLGNDVEAERQARMRQVADTRAELWQTMQDEKNDRLTENSDQRMEIAKAMKRWHLGAD